MLVNRGGKILISISAALLLLSGLLFNLFLSGCAGNPGLAAYRQGDYSEALREFRDEGDPAGEFAVGVMHYKGEGVPRNPVKVLRRPAASGGPPRTDTQEPNITLGSFICGETGLPRTTGKQRAGCDWPPSRGMPRLRFIWEGCTPVARGLRAIVRRRRAGSGWLPGREAAKPRFTWGSCTPGETA
ncbi:MAG TPA: hypothetical protein VHN12_10760 [Geobacteraceae bacterium]|nr:hypothetical protein [Geobacteraceae bacterium]